MCSQGRLLDVTPNHTQHRRNLLWSKPDELFRENFFAENPSPPPQLLVQMVNRLRIKIRQVTSRRLKQLKEVFIIGSRTDSDECIAHRAIQPGIRGIEESAGSRRSFPDKQDANS